MDLLAATAVRPSRTVIVVTHDARVFHYAHSIAHMDDGRIVNVTRPAGSPQHTESTEQPSAFQETYA
jgi:putative ABC transport system ATP-binding protein